ncbi:hypothetical protein TTHERM_000923053 (macronuclear) [Tetrahymena thermophila SB210]|uniref:Uncharacterized protein n=1 Tax=Tetrahymena thermophila (strain SB210) TaxID=312017 RepID=W7XG83_TETTS|nr:hypothetical protein TTHERM_000923053 [Tetrahymena thermophila SB210]EWS73111.1 hypothetical protein TTHERM_000923053 [Tetrahymena thermophila SB210]|eukprot:XP_012654360.1 hypothetical protein TTHERM_000923053 [Tetrahymena thermophila SB210]
MTLAQVFKEFTNQKSMNMFHFFRGFEQVFNQSQDKLQQQIQQFSWYYQKSQFMFISRNSLLYRIFYYPASNIQKYCLKSQERTDDREWQSSSKQLKFNKQKEIKNKKIFKKLERQNKKKLEKKKKIFEII